jgi:hypothetical protein
MKKTFFPRLRTPQWKDALSQRTKSLKKHVYGIKMSLNKGLCLGGCYLLGRGDCDRRPWVGNCSFVYWHWQPKEQNLQSEISCELLVTSLYSVKKEKRLWWFRIAIFDSTFSHGMFCEEPKGRTLNYSRVIYAFLRPVGDAYKGKNRALTKR